MKRIATLILAAGLVFGVATQASAIDFNAKGQWIMGFGATDATFNKKIGNQKQYSGDVFKAQQRVRLQMDAVASEALSGTVYFEIGDQTWGKADKGAALGTDGTVVEVKRAYLDWVVPNTSLSFRMGLQGVVLPNVAGGSAILDDDAAAVTATYRINDNVSVSALWARPYNDNWAGSTTHPGASSAGLLDNADFFGLLAPIAGDGFVVTPWAAIGFVGKNVINAGDKSGGSFNYVASGVLPRDHGIQNPASNRDAYRTMVFAGLPIAITAFDPLNIELDLNYGYSEGFGRYNAHSYRDNVTKRGDSKRSGWLAKALVEYKMDWGTPGIFGWYGSGDDGNVKNGSERMPNINPCGTFTSFMGDGDINGWSVDYGYDLMLNYSGTWGLGAQVTDLSFLEGLKHNLRVAYWGGTNSPSMVKYLGSSTAATSGLYNAPGAYLTTHDGLLEFNVDSTYQIYENLTATLELAYIANMIDKGTWERASYGYGTFEKGDAYKAALIMNYSF